MTTLLLSMMAASLAVYFYYPVVSTPDGVVFNVPAGMSKQAMANALSKQEVLSLPTLYFLYAMVHHDSLKTGEYLLPMGSTPVSIWRQLSTGTGLYYRSIMLVPGSTFSQFRQLLNQADGLKHMTSEASDDVIMVWLGHPDMKPEGMFSPETYFYTRGDQDLMILKRAFDLMQQRLKEAWDQRDQSVPYRTPYNALIAASIIEKEAYLKEDRPRISGVIINRLARNMPLQVDPTVIYGLGSRYDGKIYKRDLVNDTPYNTYVHKGLPPTPIAMPGNESLLAALHPEKHDYLYFVAKGNGGHQFTATLDAHHVAVATAAANRSNSISPVFFNEALIKKYLMNQLLKQ